MGFDTLLFEAARTRGPHVTLNRADKLNALNLHLIEDLRAAAAAISADSEIRAVLLTGAGRGFCSGADVAGNDLFHDPSRSSGRREHSPSPAASLQSHGHGLGTT